MAVYGLIITPVGWLNAGIVWGYALVEELPILNGKKMLTNKIQNRIKLQ
jgi:hypothetical protein